jgi:hypothetical protein
MSARAAAGWRTACAKPRPPPSRKGQSRPVGLRFKLTEKAADNPGEVAPLIRHGRHLKQRVGGRAVGGTNMGGPNLGILKALLVWAGGGMLVVGAVYHYLVMRWEAKADEERHRRAG